jgi:hypothetical protein
LHVLSPPRHLFGELHLYSVDGGGGGGQERSRVLPFQERLGRFAGTSTRLFRPAAPCFR